jgi:hypothetical protein
MTLNSDELDITSIDLKTVTPQQRDALIERAHRRAHVERARDLAEMSSHVGSWLRSMASALLSGAKVAAADPVADPHRT